MDTDIDYTDKEIKDMQDTIKKLRKANIDLFNENISLKVKISKLSEKIKELEWTIN